LNKEGKWKPPIILLSTDIKMDAEEVIDRYSQRWAIEPMFNELKNNFGLTNVCQ